MQQVKRSLPVEPHDTHSHKQPKLSNGIAPVAPKSTMTTSYPATDPAIYTIEIDELQSLPLPSTPAEWRARASHVASILARDAAARDIANASPRAEVALLKASGLLKVLGPAKYGGGGQSWEVGYQVIRDVAKGDGSLGMLLGYSLLWSTIASVVGTEEQKERFGKLITEGNFFVGGRSLECASRDDEVRRVTK